MKDIKGKNPSEIAEEVSKKITELISGIEKDYGFEFPRIVYSASSSSQLSIKHFDLVMAMDIHWLLIVGYPVPIPYPFFGMIFDPMDYIHFTLTIPAIPLLGIDQPLSIPMGGSVMVNGRHKAGTTTSIFGLAPPLVNHLGPLVMPPMGVNDGEVYFGSKSVLVQGAEMSTLDCKSLTCWDPPFASMPLPTNPRKGFKLPFALYNYPLSMNVIIQNGNPVMVGDTKVPHKYTPQEMMMRLVGMCAMKALGKALSKSFSLLKKLAKKIADIEIRGKKIRCHFGKDPVNLVNGVVYYDGIDFELPGPIPLIWERNWYSDSEYTGVMGYGTHCSYDLFLKTSIEDDAIIVHLPDGRAAFFDYLLPNQELYNREEQLTLSFDGEKYTLTDHKAQLFYEYDKVFASSDTFKVSQIYNIDGHKVVLSYSSKGQLKSIKDSVGRILTIENNHRGFIKEVRVSHRGETKKLISYAYNEAGDLIEITDALGQSTSIEYDNHCMTKKTDRNGQSFYWEYNAKRKCTKTWGDGGLLTGKFDYYKDHTVMTDERGEHIYYFNEYDLCIEKVNPLGNSTYYAYNDFQELLYEMDAEGNMTSYEYDDRGNLIKEYSPNGTCVHTEYNEYNQVISSTSGKGNTRVYKYDENQKLLHISNPDGSHLSFAYNDNGLLSQVSENELRTSFLYDEDYNIVEIISEDQGSTVMKYDNWGQNIETITPQNKRQKVTYDALGRACQINSFDNNIVNLKYDAYNDILDLRDNHTHIKLTYNPLGSIQTREEKGRVMRFDYNSENELIRIKNEKNEYYYFKRNANGDIIKERSFDGITNTFLRDRAGKVIRVDRPDERWTEYEYDANGNIIRAEHYDGSFEVFSYDDDGLLIEARNLDSSVLFKRDAMGRITEEYQNGHLVTSDYNIYGNRTSVKSSLGAEINYTKNTYGATTQIESKGWQANIGYNSLGQEIERNFSSGVSVKNAYNSSGMIERQFVSKEGKCSRSRAYTWDVNKRLTQMVDHLRAGTTTFAYDDFGNLASARYEDGSMVYKQPDKGGNVYKKAEKNDRNYAKGGQLKRDDDWHYLYDAEGKLVKKTPNTYRKDIEEFKKKQEQEKDNKGNWIDRILGYKGPKPPSPDAPTHIPLEEWNYGDWSYTWYANGMLRSVKDPKGRLTSFKYDALGRRISKTNHTTQTLQRFVWDGNVLLHEWQYEVSNQPKLSVDELGELCFDREEPCDPNSLTTWVFDDGSFTPTAKLVGNEQYSIVCDYLGTPTQAYNKAGDLVWECELDIYGKVRKLRGDKCFVPFRYQGQYEDEETGLYYNRFRYYSPDSGTYISQDPIGLLGNNPNLYAYIHDSNSCIDPLGLATQMVGDMKMGDWGEKLASKYLSNKGHTILGSVQNNSGHGFDLITKTSDGNINIIEVKTSQSSWRSKSNMPNWTNRNIDKIRFNRNGFWGNMPDYQKNLMEIIIEANQKGKLKNKLLQINIDKRSIRIICK